jgi:hypothetical protein
MNEELTHEVSEAPRKKKRSARKATYATLIIILLVALGTSTWLLARSEKPNLVSNFVKGLEAKKAVATVNGAKITRGDLDKVLMRANGGTLPTTRDAGQEQQLLEDLINIKLLTLQAEKEGVKADEAKVQEQIKGVEDRLGGADALNKQLDAVKMTRAELEENVRNDLLIRALLDKNTAITSVSASEEEVKKKYDESVAAVLAQDASSTIPSLDEVRENIQSQLVQERTVGMVQEYLNKLRGEAKIENLLTK